MKPVPMIIILVFSMFLLATDMGNSYAQSASSLNLALNAIQDAESAGADISDLMIEFNSAADFLKQVQTSEYSSCTSQDDCISNAESKFSQIIEDAKALKTESNESYIIKILMQELYIVAGSSIIAFISTASYLHWRAAQLHRFLEKKIRARD
jgi:hypothetical protein